MRYLVFDIECCDGKNICEFGYVIADEDFNIVEKQCIIINPDKPFNLVGRKGQKDLYLKFTNEQYYSSNKFDYFYEHIKKIIEQQNQIIIGHSIIHDAKFLRTACRRYKLAPINFEFYDSQRLYQEFSNKRFESLENAGDNLKIEKPEFFHKSDDDALSTLKLIKAMCDKLEMSFEDFTNLCPTSKGYSVNFDIGFKRKSLADLLNSIDSLSKKERV